MFITILRRTSKYPPFLVVNNDNIVLWRYLVTHKIIGPLKMIAKGKMDDEFVPNRQCCMFGLIFVHVNRERLLSFQHITFEMIWMCISYYREVYFTWVSTFARMYVYLPKELGFSLAINWQEWESCCRHQYKICRSKILNVNFFDIYMCCMIPVYWIWNLSCP